MTRTREDQPVRRWPAYLFGGRVRTSTVALILAFVVIWWAYESYGPATEAPDQLPAAEVVPPGFIPDPAYTWVPRTDVQRTPVTTTSTTPTTPTTSPTTSATTTPTSPTSATISPGGATAPDEDDDAETGTPTESATTGTASATTAPASTPTATPATPTP